ncbi:hypothetical protein Tco_1210747 [Tanacetum coccineum]
MKKSISANEREVTAGDSAGNALGANHRLSAVRYSQFSVFWFCSLGQLTYLVASSTLDTVSKVLCDAGLSSFTQGHCFLSHTPLFGWELSPGGFIAFFYFVVVIMLYGCYLLWLSWVIRGTDNISFNASMAKSSDECCQAGFSLVQVWAYAYPTVIKARHQSGSSQLDGVPFGGLIRVVLILSVEDVRYGVGDLEVSVSLGEILSGRKGNLWESNIDGIIAGRAIHCLM